MNIKVSFFSSVIMNKIYMNEIIWLNCCHNYCWLLMTTIRSNTIVSVMTLYESIAIAKPKHCKGNIDPAQSRWSQGRPGTGRSQTPLILSIVKLVISIYRIIMGDIPFTWSPLFQSKDGQTRWICCAFKDLYYIIFLIWFEFRHPNVYSPTILFSFPYFERTAWPPEPCAWQCLGAAHCPTQGLWDPITITTSVSARPGLSPGTHWPVTAQVSPSPSSPSPPLLPTPQLYKSNHKLGK